MNIMGMIAKFLEGMSQCETMTMADRLVILGRDLRHMDHCEHPESCYLCRVNKQKIKENVPQWAQDLARTMNKNPAMQFRAVFENLCAQEIADRLGVTLNIDEAA